jgi:hypothetical protein
MSIASLASVLLAGCSSTSSSPAGSDASSGPDANGSGLDASGPMDASMDVSADANADAITDAGLDAGALGGLVDNMTATVGTQIQLGSDAGGAPLPAGETPGTFYGYVDAYSVVTAVTADTPVNPPVTNPDGSQIVGEICFGGDVLVYAGLGLNLAYQAKAPDASASAPSPVEPYDASKYSGVSFYIYLDPGDGGPLPQLHFGVPDTQTAGPSWPTSSCLDLGDGSTADCYDDFGSDLIVTPGTWSKQSFAWSDLTQGNWAAQYPLGLKTNQLIGMKWQANGPPVDSGLGPLSFNFCVSDIYFTP